MALLRVTGFESGSTAEAFSSGGTISFATTGQRTGAYALRVNPTTTALGYFTVSSGISAATIIVGFAFKPVTLPASGAEQFIRMRASTVDKAELRISSAGIVTLYNSTVLIATGTTTLTAGTYYYIELKIGSGATAVYELRIDGTTEFSGTYSNSANNTDVYFIGKSVNRSSQSVDFYYDDMYFDDAAFQATTTAFPEVRILLPNAAGGSAGWSAGTSPHTFAAVDEVPPESDGTDASYIEATATDDNLYTTFRCESTTAKSVTGTVLAVEGFVWAKTGSTSGTSTVAIRMRNGATNVDMPGLELTVAYQGLHNLQVLDPNTAAAWTLGGVDTCEIGMTAATIAQSQRFTAAYLFVLTLVSDGVGTPRPIQVLNQAVSRAALR